MEGLRGENIGFSPRCLLLALYAVSYSIAAALHRWSSQAGRHFLHWDPCLPSHKAHKVIPATGLLWNCEELIHLTWCEICSDLTTFILCITSWRFLRRRVNSLLESLTWDLRINQCVHCCVSSTFLFKIYFLILSNEYKTLQTLSGS